MCCYSLVRRDLKAQAIAQWQSIYPACMRTGYNTQSHQITKHLEVVTSSSSYFHAVNARHSLLPMYRLALFTPPATSSPETTLAPLPTYTKNCVLLIFNYFIISALLRQSTSVQFFPVNNKFFIEPTFKNQKENSIGKRK